MQRTTAHFAPLLLIIRIGCWHRCIKKAVETKIKIRVYNCAAINQLYQVCTVSKRLQLNHVPLTF